MCTLCLKHKLVTDSPMQMQMTHYSVVSLTVIWVICPLIGVERRQVRTDCGFAKNAWDPVVESGPFTNLSSATSIVPSSNSFPEIP